jgi:hypothetical protein
MPTLYIKTYTLGAQDAFMVSAVMTVLLTFNFVIIHDLMVLIVLHLIQDITTHQRMTITAAVMEPVTNVVDNHISYLEFSPTKQFHLLC